MAQTLGNYFIERLPGQDDIWCLFEGEQLLLKGKTRDCVQAVCATLRGVRCAECDCGRCGEPTNSSKGPPHLS